MSLQFDDCPAMLNCTQLKEFLNVSKSVAYAIMHRKDFPTLHIGSRLFVTRANLLRWLESNADKIDNYRNDTTANRITDERTELRYALVGDYYLPTNIKLPETPQIGIWGQRRLCFLREHKDGIYTGMLLNGKLNEHLSEIDMAATEMFDRLINQMKQAEGITEQLKADDQMKWVRQMNSICSRAEEIVFSELIYQ